MSQRQQRGVAARSAGLILERCSDRKLARNSSPLPCTHRKFLVAGLVGRLGLASAGGSGRGHSGAQPGDSNAGSARSDDTTSAAAKQAVHVALSCKWVGWAGNGGGGGEEQTAAHAGSAHDAE